MPAGLSLRADAFINAFSLEVSAKAMPALRAEADRIPRGTVISIPYLASEDDDAAWPPRARCARSASSRCRISRPAASGQPQRLHASWNVLLAKPESRVAC